MIEFTTTAPILVTGASSGFGAASALLLNKLGASVIAVARCAERLEQIRSQSANPSSFLCEPYDLVQNPAEIGQWVQGLKQRHGKMSGLLQCAGQCWVNPVRTQEYEDMRQLFDINVFAGYQLARAFLDRRSNIGKGASIVFIASTSALWGDVGTSSYCASKGAVISMMRALAREYLPQAIRVNSISPALVSTPLTQKISPNLETEAQTYPLGPGQPEDIAQLAAFLLSDASRWMTGQNLVIDGGIGLAQQMSV